MSRYLIATWMVLALSASAFAQTAAQDAICAVCYGDVPDEGWVGLTGAFGVLVPHTDQYKPAWTLVGSADVYLSRQVALRPAITWAESDAKLRHYDQVADALEGRYESLRRVGFLLDVVVNWKQGRWQPFASAGFGLHLFQQKLPNVTVQRDDEVHFGGQVGGGVEFFVRQQTAITATGLYQAIERGRLQESPSGVVLLLGVKQYF